MMPVVRVLISRTIDNARVRDQCEMRNTARLEGLMKPSRLEHHRVDLPQVMGETFRQLQQRSGQNRMNACRVENTRIDPLQVKAVDSDTQSGNAINGRQCVVVSISSVVPVVYLRVPRRTTFRRVVTPHRELQDIPAAILFPLNRLVHDCAVVLSHKCGNCALVNQCRRSCWHCIILKTFCLLCDDLKPVQCWTIEKAKAVLQNHKKSFFDAVTDVVLGIRRRVVASNDFRFQIRVFDQRHWRDTHSIFEQVFR